MSVATFVPQIWEARLLANFYEKSITGIITTPPAEIKGNKIIFNNVSDVAVNDYAGTVTWAELTTSKVEMNMDIEKYWAFKVDDIDKVQVAGDLINAHTNEASSKMQSTMDGLVLTEALKTTLVATKGTNEIAYDIIVNANMELNKKKVPKNERFTIINAEVLAELHKDARFTKEYKIMENGIMEGANINGATLVFSEELNAGKYAIVALHKSALGFGSQLEKTEAMRLEGAFADGIRGLQVAGVKLIRPNAVVKYVPAP